MGGMKNRLLFALMLGSFLLSVFLSSTCSPKKVPLDPRRPPPETKGVRRGVYHVVERHQTLYRICKTYGADLREVASLNGIADHSKIRVGQRIFIPGAKKVLKVEVLIEDVVAEPWEEERDKWKVHKTTDFIWPVEGKLGDLFEEDENRRHQGIDIRSLQGTLIKASSAGVVIYSGNTIKGYGNMVILRHSEEFVTVYAHNEVNLVAEGEWVEKGQIIARVGQTGRASGPHLHFEVRRNNRAVDPLLFLK